MMRERKRDYTRGLVDSVMPVGQQFMQPLAPAMQVMLQMLAFRRVVSAGAKALH